MRGTAIGFLSVALGAGVAAQMYGPDYVRCRDQPTAELTACIGARAKVWDSRLNAAYQALVQRSEPGQREPLRAAQRIWIQYRDANCRFYAAGGGTISQVESAECLRAMTQQRTCEIEAANRQEGSVGADCKR